MVDIKQLIGYLITITTSDGKIHFGELKAYDADGWLFMNSYGRTTAIDQKAVVSISIPEGYFGKNMIVRDE